MPILRPRKPWSINSQVCRYCGGSIIGISADEVECCRSCGKCHDEYDDTPTEPLTIYELAAIHAHMTCAESDD